MEDWEKDQVVTAYEERVVGHLARRGGRGRWRHVSVRVKEKKKQTDSANMRTLDREGGGRETKMKFPLTASKRGRIGWERYQDEKKYNYPDGKDQTLKENRTSRRRGDRAQHKKKERRERLRTLRLRGKQGDVSCKPASVERAGSQESCCKGAR